MAGEAFAFQSMGIGRLIKSGRLAVPPNQRAYAWEDRHILNLFHDLNEALSSRDAQSYFLGTIVLIQAGHGTPIIADGQQRLATTSILLARIRDYLHSIKRVQSALSIDQDFLRTIDRDTEQNVPKIALNIEDNEFHIRTILSGPMDGDVSELPAVRPSNVRLNKASELAKQFVLDILKPQPEGAHAELLLHWVSYLEHDARLVVVTVADESSAFRIFETLNDRGLKASQADILKNYFLSKASPKRLPEAHTLWNTISVTVENLEDDENEALVTYIRHLWITTHGPTKERELAAEIRSEVTAEGRTFAFLTDARAAVRDYMALSSQHHPKWEDYKASTRQNIEIISEHLQVEQIRPLLFAVARNFDVEEADKAFRLFVSWSVRFLIFGGRGGLLDIQYSNRAKEVGTKQITKARDLRDAMARYVRP